MLGSIPVNIIILLEEGRRMSKWELLSFITLEIIVSSERIKYRNKNLKNDLSLVCLMFWSMLC